MSALALTGCGDSQQNESAPAAASSSAPAPSPQTPTTTPSVPSSSVNPTSTIDATAAPTMIQSQRQVPPGSNVSPPAAPEWNAGDEAKAVDLATRALKAFGAGGSKTDWKARLDPMLTVTASNALSTIQNPDAIKFTVQGAGRMEQETKTEYTVWVTFKTSRGPWSVQVMRNAAFPDWKANEIIPSSARS